MFNETPEVPDSVADFLRATATTPAPAVDAQAACATLYREAYQRICATVDDLLFREISATPGNEFGGHIIVALIDALADVSGRTAGSAVVGMTETDNAERRELALGIMQSIQKRVARYLAQALSHAEHHDR